MDGNRLLKAEASLAVTRIQFKEKLDRHLLECIPRQRSKPNKMILDIVGGPHINFPISVMAYCAKFGSSASSGVKVH